MRHMQRGDGDERSYEGRERDAEEALANDARVVAVEDARRLHVEQRDEECAIRHSPEERAADARAPSSADGHGETFTRGKRGGSRAKSSSATCRRCAGAEDGCTSSR